MHMQTEHGLMVPIVKDADTKGLGQISSDVKVGHFSALNSHAAADMRHKAEKSVHSESERVTHFHAATDEAEL